MITCECKVVHTNTRKGKRNTDRDACGEKATWVIRKDGKQFFACNTHKSAGILVKKIG